MKKTILKITGAAFLMFAVACSSDESTASENTAQTEETVAEEESVVEVETIIEEVSKGAEEMVEEVNALGNDVDSLLSDI